MEPDVLQRLASANPLEALHAGNIADYWTALEGVSHFVYLAWNATYDRPVTPVELELQGEIDKYVSSLWLLREQDPTRSPVELHQLLFEHARVDAVLAGDHIGLMLADKRGESQRMSRFPHVVLAVIRPLIYRPAGDC